MSYKLFSVDDHIIEPRDVWTSRLPRRFQESGPHVIEAQGREFWIYEDQRSAITERVRREGLRLLTWIVTLNVLLFTFQGLMNPLGRILFFHDSIYNP